MNKSTLVVDLDNVLARSAETFVAFSNEHFGTDITIEDYDEDWERMWGVAHEEAVRRGTYMRARHIHRSYEPMPGAKTALDSLHKKYRLVILTSRGKAVELETTEWLGTHYPGLFDEVLFSGIWDDAATRNGHLLTKGDRYRELGAGYVIDDYLKHCAAAVQGGVPALLFGDYPWNRADTLPAGVTRCADWLAVLEYFDGAD